MIKGTSIKKVYLLDKNVIDLIKRCNSRESRPYDSEEDMKMLAKLVVIDLFEEGAVFSGLLSVIEGNQKGVLDYNGFIAHLKKESDALSGFFKRARCDSSVLVSGAEVLFEALVDGADYDYQKNNGFLISSKECGYIQNKVSPGKKKETYGKVLSCARSHGLDVGSPVVMLVLGCVAGSDQCVKLLNLRKNKNSFYNALSDIYNFKMCAYSEYLFNYLGGVSVDTEVLTCDAALSWYLNTVKAKVVLFDKIVYGDTSVRYKYMYSRDFFGDIDDLDFDFLMEITDAEFE